MISAASPAEALARTEGPVHVVVVDPRPGHGDVRHHFPTARVVTIDAAPLGDVLAAVVEQLGRAAPGYRAPVIRPHVLRVVEYASVNYTVGSLVALGALVGASPRHLLRVFREDVGMGVKEYMNRVRVEVAKPLLAAGEKLEAVAQHLGVSSGAHVSRLFRRHTGDRPGWFRVHHDADVPGGR